MHRPENVQRSAFKRMARADNRDFFGKVLITGSVSWVRSMGFPTPGWLRSSSIESRTGASCGSSRNG